MFWQTIKSNVWTSQWNPLPNSRQPGEWTLNCSTETFNEHYAAMSHSTWERLPASSMFPDRCKGIYIQKLSCVYFWRIAYLLLKEQCLSEGHISGTKQPYLIAGFRTVPSPGMELIHMAAPTRKALTCSPVSMWGLATWETLSLVMALQMTFTAEDTTCHQFSHWWNCEGHIPHISLPMK